MKKVQAPEKEVFARIRVFGIGGSGKNAINHMVRAGLQGVEFIVANSDAQDLETAKALRRLHLGKKVTRGLGTGMNPSLGRLAAEEAKNEIIEAIKGADLVFIACGMGGGTGTGASPVIAKLAKDLGVLTIGIVTKPFKFEGGARETIAEEGLAELRRVTDSIVIIPNDNILKAIDKKTSMAEAFSLSDEILHRAVQGISELITTPGDINIDFADVKTIMENSGIAIMGIGEGKGANRAELAVQAATSSPLLDTSINGAKRVLFSIASRTRRDIAMSEAQLIAEKIGTSIDPNAKVIFGTTTDKAMHEGMIRVTVVATAFENGGDTQTATTHDTYDELVSPNIRRVAEPIQDEDVMIDEPQEQDTPEETRENVHDAQENKKGIFRLPWI